MKTLEQNGAHDIVLTPDGDFSFVEDVDAYATIIADAVRTLIGELQLDIEAGIPWLETIFNSPRDIDLWKHNVIKTTEAFPFVDVVDYIEAQFNSETNTLNYSMKVKTNKGIVEVTNG